MTTWSRPFDARKGLFFHTPGGARVLVPWGGEASVNRKIDATDPVEVSEALVECRQMVVDEAARLRASVPGFEDAYVSLMADQLGITESTAPAGRVRDDPRRPRPHVR